MSKIYTASQLVYTSWPNGNSPKKGFMVYSKSEDISPLETEEINNSFRYASPANLPFAPNEEQIRTLFPRMFAFVRLSSGRYVIGASTYIGQDYSKRYGNYLCHAFVFNENPYSLVLPLMDSSLFKTHLSQEELFAPKAPDSLPKIDISDSLPFMIPSLNLDPSYFASLLEIITENLDSKKINVFLDKKDMEEFTKCLFYALPKEIKEKFFFNTFACGKNELFKYLVRLKEEYSQNNMNPLSLYVSSNNYRQVLGREPSSYSLMLGDMMKQDPSRLPSFVLEVNAYVNQGLVSNMEEAIALKRLKSNDYSKISSFLSIQKYLLPLSKLCSISYFDKLYSFCINSFSNEKKDIYENFFFRLNEDRKKEIFVDYLNLNDSSFPAFLRKAMTSTIKEYALDVLSDSFKNHPSLFENALYLSIFEIIYPSLAKDRQRELLFLAFESLFEKNPSLYNTKYAPLLKQEFASDTSFALRIYEQEKNKISPSNRIRFNDFFYSYLGKEEQASLWNAYFKENLTNSRNISLEKLLDSHFGKKEDGLVILDYNLDKFALSFKNQHPDLLFSLYLARYNKGEVSSYAYLEEYYLKELKNNRIFSFLEKKMIPASLKKRLYQSPFRTPELLKEKLNLNNQDKFNYLRKMLEDISLKDYSNFFNAFFFVESVFPESRTDLDRMLLSYLDSFTDIQSLKNANLNNFKANEVFKKMELDKFQTQSFNSCEDFLRAFKNQILSNKDYTPLEKQGILASFISKLSVLLDNEKNDPFSKGLSCYASLKDYLNDPMDRRKLLSILVPYVEKLSLSSLEKKYLSNQAFLSLLKDLESNSLLPYVCSLGSDGRFLRQKDMDMEKRPQNKQFAFQNELKFKPYKEEFIDLYLEDALKNYALLFERYFKSGQHEKAIYLAFTFVTPFMDARNFEKIFLKALQRNRYVLSIIACYIVNNTTIFSNRMIPLCDAFFKSLDKKSREQCFEELKKQKNPLLNDYIAQYERNHKGFFAKIFGK